MRQYPKPKEHHPRIHGVHVRRNAEGNLWKVQRSDEKIGFEISRCWKNPEKSAVKTDNECWLFLSWTEMDEEVQNDGIKCALIKKEILEVLTWSE